MDWKDGACPGCYRAFHLRYIHRISLRLNIDEHWLGTDVTDRPRGCNKCKRNGDDFVPCTNPAGDDRQVERACSRIDADTVANTAISGKLRFKCFYKRSGGKITTVQDALKCVANLVLHRRELAPEI